MAVVTHGQTGSPTYRRWIAMKSRCFDKKHPHFDHYSKLGVEPEWASSFEAFRGDVGECPSRWHSLDRIDGARGYFRGNVRWATPREQGRNRVDNLKVVVGGEEWLVVELAEEFGLKYTTIKERIRRGWEGHDLVAPVGAFTRWSPRT